MSDSKKTFETQPDKSTHLEFSTNVNQKQTQKKSSRLSRPAFPPSGFAPDPRPERRKKYVEK